MIRRTHLDQFALKYPLHVISHCGLLRGALMDYPSGTFVDANPSCLACSKRKQERDAILKRVMSK